MSKDEQTHRSSVRNFRYCSDNQERLEKHFTEWKQSFSTVPQYFEERNYVFDNCRPVKSINKYQDLWLCHDAYGLMRVWENLFPYTCETPEVAREKHNRSENG